MNDLKRLPSQEKPWLKFFSEEAINATLPKKTIYSYMREKNEGFEKNTAINFFGNKISYGEFLGTVDGCAASFAALGVGKGDVVACCSTLPLSIRQSSCRSLTLSGPWSSSPLIIICRFLSENSRRSRCRRRASERSSGTWKRRPSGGMMQGGSRPDFAATIMTEDAKTGKHTAGSPCGAYIETIKGENHQLYM